MEAPRTRARTQGAPRPCASASAEAQHARGLSSTLESKQQAREEELRRVAASGSALKRGTCAILTAQQ